MAKVEVRGLSFHAHHGCHPHERKSGGVFKVDLTVEGDFSASMESDDIADAVDYVALMDLCERIMKTPKNLIETVAHDIAWDVLRRFSAVNRVEVTVKKMKPPVKHDLEFVSASISLERG